MDTTFCEKDKKIRQSIKVLSVTAVTLCVLIVLLVFVDMSVQNQLRQLEGTLNALEDQKKVLKNEVLFVDSEYYNEKIIVDILKGNVDGATVIRFDR
ncbi:MAG TPA: hypothetical protein GX508_03605 [Coprothermobacter sp.]|nr:hypothetical protein [Coprothermobacter sp.]